MPKSVRPQKSSSRPVVQSRKKSSKNLNSTSPASPNFAVIIALVFLCVILGTLALFKFAGWHVFMDGRQEWQVTQEVTLEGTVHFTALKPDPQDKGEIKVFVKAHDDDQWSESESSLPLQQDAVWQWQALPGVPYDVQAALIIDGKEIKKSEVVAVLAPSHAVTLPLKVTWKDLPEEVVAGSTTNLAGEVALNGFVPETATLEIYSLNKKYYENELFEITPEVLAGSTLIATIKNPQNTVRWQWDKAVPLDQYVIVAVLKDKNQIISTADQILRADASEDDLKQVIDSEAQPPKSLESQGQTRVLGANTIADSLAQLAQANSAPKTSLTGTVFLEGPKQKDTSLLVLWRKPGDKNYNVVNRYMYPAHKGTAWQWTDAQVGQKYEITSALQVDEQNTSTAPNSTIVTAPATKIDMTINTYYVITRTDQKPVFEVCINKGGNEATAVIRLPKVANAEHYWLQVGKSIGGSDVYDQRFPSPTNDQDAKVQVRVESGKQNFMKYAYATCVNCQSESNFAPFSDDVSFTCN